MSKQALKVPTLRNICGTVLGWRVHRGHGERPCLICRKAMGTYLQDNPPDPPTQPRSELLTRLTSHQGVKGHENLGESPAAGLLGEPMPTFICPYPDCGTVSYDPDAARELYCSACQRCAVDLGDEEDPDDPRRVP